MYVSRGYWAILGIALTIAVVLGLAVGGFRPLDYALHISQTVPVYYTSTIVRSFTTTSIVNNTIVVNRTVTYTMPVTYTSVSTTVIPVTFTTTVVVNNTVTRTTILVYNRTVTVTVPVTYTTTVYAELSGAALNSLNASLASAYVNSLLGQLMYNVSCMGTMAIGPNGTFITVVVMLAPRSMLKGASYTRVEGNVLLSVDWPGGGALLAGLAQVGFGPYLMVNATLPGGYVVLFSVAKWPLSFPVSEGFRPPPNGSLIPAMDHDYLHNINFAPCLIQVLYFRDWGSLLNSTYLGAQFVAYADALYHGESTPCARPWLWTIGEFAGEPGTRPIGANWEAICG